MRVKVEVTTEDLAAMDVTASQLEVSVREKLSSLDVESGTVYVNEVEVAVVVNDEN